MVNSNLLINALLLERTKKNFSYDPIVVSAGGSGTTDYFAKHN